jgi:predicted transcriptional regulator
MPPDLGPLERTVMDHVWRAGQPLLVRELLDRINGEAQRPLAYTTVQTVADRLVRKGMLRRLPAGNANQYVATRTRDEHVARLMADALLDSDDSASVFQRFVQLVDPRDAAQLRAALDRNRRQRRRR